MFTKTVKLLSWLVLCAAGLGVGLFMAYRTNAASAPAAEGRSGGEPKLLKSQVVRWDAASLNQADWGQMRTYFRGQTHGTKDVLTAVAVVEPGKAVHRAHRHAQEEYLILVAGSGTWSLAGKEFPASRGDILYAESWVYHGLTNTGSESLIFVVVRYSPKGVDVPPRPDSRPDEL